MPFGGSDLVLSVALFAIKLTENVIKIEAMGMPPWGLVTRIDDKQCFRSTNISSDIERR